GWRIHYCDGPHEVVAAMATVQGPSSSKAPRVSQRARTGAPDGVQLGGAEACRFYASADGAGAVRSLELKDDTELAEYLLANALVAVVPGSGFGAPNHLRISFATSMENLKEALNRIRLAVSPAVAKRA